MREILFRGKRKDSGEWLQGFLWEGNDSSYIIPNSLGITYYEKENRVMAFANEVDPETVCQYTGLTDKNGRKIFEGDIVKAIYKPKDEDLTIDDFIIKWDKYYCKFVGHYTNKENVYNPLLFGSQTSFEVIGNIFDNPELIGK